MSKALQRWAGSTTMHGPAHVLDSSTNNFSSLVWILITIAALCGAVLLSLNQFTQYFHGEIHTKLMPIESVGQAAELVRLTYCPDDWIDVDKVRDSNLGVEAFEYFLTLLPGLYNFDIINDGGAHDLNNFWDEFNITTGSRFRLESAYADENTIYVKSHFRYNTSKLNTIARIISQFARVKNLRNIKEFATYFARNNISLGDTRIVGTAIYLGQLCFELAVEQSANRSLFEIQQKQVKFHLQYTLNYGKDPTSDEEFYDRKHRIALLPYLGIGVPSFPTQTRLYEVSVDEERKTPTFIRVNEALTSERLENMRKVNQVGYFYKHIDNIKELLKKNYFIQIRMSLRLRRRRKPNAGRAPCIEQFSAESRLPLEYSQWQCEDRCITQHSTRILRATEQCDFVRDGSIMDVPCNCLRYKVETEYFRDNKFTMCALPDSELRDCVKKCETVDPFCTSYHSRMHMLRGSSGSIAEPVSVDLLGHHIELTEKYGVPIEIVVDVSDAMELTEYLATTAGDLIIGLGGTAGFCMGISVLSIIHLFTSLIALCRDIFKKTKENIATAGDLESEEENNRTDKSKEDSPASAAVARE